VEIDDKLLTEVARGTGGRYFRARDAEALARVTQEIDRLERTTYRQRRTPPRSDWYLWPAGLGLLALLGEVVLRWWRGTVP
jgi:Ca-activated chloride channel family protein